MVSRMHMLIFTQMQRGNTVTARSLIVMTPWLATLQEVHDRVGDLYLY